MTATRMASADSAWLGIDAPDNLMIVTAVLRLEGRVDPERFAAVVQERIVARYPTFRRRVLPPTKPFGRSVWSDDEDFDLAAHVVPGSRVAESELDLADLVSDLLGTPLDMTRPPWQFRVVDGPMGTTTVVARLHHCIADGIALAGVLLSLTDGADGADGADDAENADNDTHLSGAATQPSRLVWGRLRLASAVVATGLRVLTFSRDPRTRLHAPLGMHKAAAWTRPAELDRLKDISRRLGVTLNDVLLAVTAGALRRHLLAHGEPPRDLRIFMPVNLRRPGRTPSESLGNCFGLVFLSLPISVADPERRLPPWSGRTRRLKAGQQAAATFALLSVVGASPRWAQRLAARLLGSKSTAVVTNVRGPSQPVTLAGAPLDGLLFWVPQTGSVGLGVSILSYAGAVTVGIAVDRNVMGRPSEFADAVETEIAELANRLG